MVEKDIGVCGKCYKEGVELVWDICEERPERLTGEPVGMYHCPFCGTMLLGGLPHPPLCVECAKEVEGVGV